MTTQLIRRSNPIPALEPRVGLGRQAYQRMVVGDDLRPRRQVDLSVVVVTHESRAHVDACLGSLLASCAGMSFEVLVVDNASTDGTADRAAELFPAVRVIRKRDRHGFATNCNIGIVAAAGRAILLLNPDTIVPPGAVQSLLHQLDVGDQVGAVGPRLVYPDGTDQRSARRFPSAAATLVRRTPVRRFLPAVADLHLRDDLTGRATVDVDWMLGAALLVRREALEEVGGLDDGYRLYCEDIDLCWRLHERGWRVLCVTGTTVVHELAELTRKRFLTRRTLWHYRSMFRFVRLHGLRLPPSAAAVGCDEPAPRAEVDARIPIAPFAT